MLSANVDVKSVQKRTTWEFLQLLDEKFIKSRGETAWLNFARRHNQIQAEE